VVRDVGPGVGWPTLTKTNYVEWAAIMRIRLQVWHLWEAVQDGDVNHHEDRRALDALIAAVPPEIQFSLSRKRTAKEAWDAIAATRIGSDRTHKSTLQALRKEWESLTFKPGEDVDDFALRLNTVLLQKLVQFGDDNYDEERAVEKLFRCVPKKYKQMARSIESLLDLSMMSIKEAIGRLKVVDTDEPQPLSGPSTLVGSYFSLGSNGMPAKVIGRRGSRPWQGAQGAQRRPSRGARTCCGRCPRRRPGWRRPQAQAGTRRHLPHLQPAWPLGQGLSTATMLPGRCRTGGGGGAGSTWHMRASAPAAAALLHLDEPKAQALLGDGSGSDKTNGWCLDTDTTHHMTGRREFFIELDSNVRGYVKFGDASAVEIKGVGSVIFTADWRAPESTGCSPVSTTSPRNSIISLG
jgi:hypothetical protein